MNYFAFTLGAGLVVALDLALYGWYRQCVAWRDAQRWERP